MADLVHLPANRAIRLRNVLCAYCGCALDRTSTTKEHVVGRRFVPKGKLEAQWNLIVNSCYACNNRKADFENDISAISLYPVGGGADQESISRKEVLRKIDSAISRRTRRPVRDSQETLKLELPFNKDSTISFGLSAPPQIDDNRAFELARLQLAAFFFWITYQANERRGYWWTGGYHPLMMVRRPDFGNSIMVDFADAVMDWDPRIVGSTADGHFRVCVRRHPEAECWSWAIEWNCSTRLIGFLGDIAVAEATAKLLGPLRFNHQDLGDHLGLIRFRTEVPLAPEDDKLFFAPN